MRMYEVDSARLFKMLEMAQNRRVTKLKKIAKRKQFYKNIKEKRMKNRLGDTLILLTVLTLIGLLGFYSSSVFAGGADQDTYTCTKTVVPDCKVKTVIKYKTKTVVKHRVIDRPVQEVVMRYRNKTHKNRVSILVGRAYNDDAKVSTHTTKDKYGNIVDKSFSLRKADRELNLGIQYQRDVYQSENYSIHGLIQYQSVTGPSVGLGIGW